MKLTVAIPTYNRAELLKGLLENLSHQISEHVEVVICDNCSPDHTREVCTAFPFVKYYRNSENIGGANNVLKVVELANGDYCWIIGDDDRIRSGGIEAVLNATEHGTDIIYVNQSYEAGSYDNIDEIKGSVLCSRRESGLLSSGQIVGNYVNTSALFTSVSSMVFKTSVFKEGFKGYIDEPLFTSLYSTFPHSLILSKSIIKKPVYYIGYPYMAFYVGAQEWIGDWPYLNLIRVLELSDEFQKHGASREFLRKYRGEVFKSSAEPYYELLKNKHHKFSPYFSRSAMIRKYSIYPAFRKLEFDVMKRMFKERVKAALGLTHFL